MTVARYLMVGVGVFWLVIGVLSAALTGKGIGPPMVFVSERTDTELFGAPPDEVLATNPALATLRHILIRVLAGLLVAAGLLTASMAWFGLRSPSVVILATLTVVGLAVLPYWWISLAPYREAGIDLTLGDIPPFMWVPAILMPVASLLAWIDYLRS